MYLYIYNLYYKLLHFESSVLNEALTQKKKKKREKTKTRLEIIVLKRRESEGRFNGIAHRVKTITNH